jgi:antitoxin (DNA-binding transcriptional repressor) of toxin-antitoxin stability system
MQVNVQEAKRQLSRLLELIEEGEKVIIARHGHPVAELVWPQRFSLLAPPEKNCWWPTAHAESTFEKHLIAFFPIRDRFLP